MRYKKPTGPSPTLAITNSILEKLRAGTRPWVRPWREGQGGLPIRENGQRYRGINSLWLWMVADENGFASNRWMTYRQAQSVGGQVRKGERSSIAVFYKQIGTADEEADSDAAADGEGASGIRRVLKSYHVFNCDQIENLPERYAPEPVGRMEVSDHKAAIDAFIRASGAQVRHGGDRAFYNPKADTIQLPLPEQFLSYQGYGAVAAHELSHWTGHQSRLDRDLTGRFKSDAYAMEEMIAELAAATIGGELQLPVEHLENHASYIATWIKVLENDERALFTAAAKAEAAADYLLAKAGLGLRNEAEAEGPDIDANEPERLAA